MTGRDAIICGSGPDFWADLVRARRVTPVADLIGVNLTGLYLHNPRHLVSLHGEMLGPLRELRRSLDWAADPVICGGAPVTHSIEHKAGVDRVWPHPPWGLGGTSSLFAVWVALSLGYQRILLAGVPMDGTGRFFDPEDGSATIWPHDGASDRGAWERAAGLGMLRTVQSCSGWTAELLGEPAPEVAAA